MGPIEFSISQLGAGQAFPKGKALILLSTAEGEGGNLEECGEQPEIN
jgi:hypothetical protein